MSSAATVGTFMNPLATTARGQPSASAERRRSRQRTRKIAGNPELRDFVQEHLEQRWGPARSAIGCALTSTGQPEMHVVPEAVYQALYGRASLDLAVNPAASLRTGRTVRRPRRRKEHRTKRSPDKVMIRDRPREVTSRLVPGHLGGRLDHWKGQPLGNRHVGRRDHTLHHPRAFGRQPRSRKSARPASRNNERPPGPPAPFPHRGSGHRTGLPPELYAADSYTAVIL